MLRLLLKDITIERKRGQRTAVLHLRWQGGAVEDLHIVVPPPAPDKVRYPQQIVERVRALAISLQDPQIAAALNQEGLLGAKGGAFTTAIIKWIRRLRNRARPFPTPRLRAAPFAGFIGGTMSPLTRLGGLEGVSWRKCLEIKETIG